ncbi:MAG TPA: hypothetical protein VMV44_11845 [Rectinemataceae bacterium]|nr:hypothetical protein [Rectinemataceae bacterium]
MNEADIDRRLRLLPPIRRARFWRLYAEDGRRYLDLFQDGGRGILGARQARMALGIKAAVDRGLDRPLPSRLEARLEKAVLALAPAAKAFRIYRNEEEALAILARIAGSDAAEAIASGIFDSPLILDPARKTQDGKDGRSKALARLIRPFASWLPPSPAPLPRIALPLLPLPRGMAPAILLFEEAEEAEMAGPSRLVSPLALRAVLDALATLAAYQGGAAGSGADAAAASGPGPSAGAAVKPAYHAKADEAHWRRIDRRTKGLFDRSGPWLYPRAGIEDWDRIFEEALASGILLSPDPGLPSILPGDFDDGEIAPLANIRP